MLNQDFTFVQSWVLQFHHKETKILFKIKWHCDEKKIKWLWRRMFVFYLNQLCIWSLILSKWDNDWFKTICGSSGIATHIRILISDFDWKKTLRSRIETALFRSKLNFVCLTKCLWEALLRDTGFRQPKRPLTHPSQWATRPKTHPSQWATRGKTYLPESATRDRKIGMLIDYIRCGPASSRWRSFKCLFQWPYSGTIHLHRALERRTRKERI